MYHLFGNILTRHGISANNRGEVEGNITTLQKLSSKGGTYSTVSAEAIRWALRYYWQLSGYSVNRQWDEDTYQFSPQIADFDPVEFIDDDVLGYMRAEAAKVENHGSEVASTEASEENASSKKNKAKSKNSPKGSKLARRGVLEVTRAVSLVEFVGDVTFNAVSSSQKGRTSLYATEVHATRYQYGFAMTPHRLKSQSRVCAVLDGLATIGEVAGNHGRFLYDFSPESIVLRWTHDFSPRFLYCFLEDEEGNISVPDLVQQMRSGDIDPEELWVGGPIAATLGEWGVHSFPGVKVAVSALKETIQATLSPQRQ